MDLNRFTDAEIETNLENLVLKERLGLSEILYHIMEVRDRKIYLKQAYPSLHAYCVQKLKYPGEQAYRRIAAMELLRECPAIKEEIDQGNLNLTQLGQAKSFFSEQAKKDEALTPEAKKEFLATLCGKSTRETEKLIAELNPEAAKKDKVRSITAKLTEIRFVASEALMQKLTRFKELDSHTLKNPSYADVFERLVDLALVQKEKAMQPKPQTKKPTHVKAKTDLNESDSNDTQTSAQRKPTYNRQVKTSHIKALQVKVSQVQSVVRPERSRYIPTSVKREVYLRDHGKCTFENPVTGKRCESRKKIQYDHLQPFSMGGEHAANNLTLRCQSHNLFSAEQYFGRAYHSGAKIRS